MSAHRFKLASNTVPKLNCPVCHAKKHWQRYIDTETGEILPEQHGRCDNQSKCGHWVTPKETGYAKAIWQQEQGYKTDWQPQQPKQKKKPVNKSKIAFIPVEVLRQTQAGFEKNVFIQNLLLNVAFPFTVQDVERVISLYQLGTVQHGYRKGAVTFPFIDLQNNIRAIQVKQFNEKNSTKSTDFLPSIIEKHHTRNNKPLPEWLAAYNKNETKVSCLFGEHLLRKYTQNPVALVEAPKTAIYGTLYFGLPEQPTNFLWLAVYNLSSLNLNKCKALKGRNVYLFPDLSKDGHAFNEWSAKAEQLQNQIQGAYFQTSNLLEQLAPEHDKQQGNDIADYLIKQDWRLFRTIEKPKAQTLSPEQLNKVELLKEAFEMQAAEVAEIQPEPEPIETPENWSVEIQELETYYTNTTLPTHPVQLNQCSTITNCSNFVKNHLATVKNNNGKRTFLPYLNRLQDFKEILINQVISN